MRMDSYESRAQYMVSVPSSIRATSRKRERDEEAEAEEEEDNVEDANWDSVEVAIDLVRYNVRRLRTRRKGTMLVWNLQVRKNYYFFPHIRN